MKKRIKKISVTFFLGFCAVLTAGWGHSPYTQSQRYEKNPLAKWKPGKDFSGIRYLGSGVCAQCHRTKVASQSLTPMAHALTPCADCQILITHPQLEFQQGPYTYQITRKGNRSIYAVSDGINTISETILYCFGHGVAGQTYLFQHNGLFYESRVSFYAESKKLDLTIEHPRSIPGSLEAALGRPMSQEAASGCFACHATGAVKGTQLQLGSLIPGVTCEACHGPGESHVTSVKSKNLTDLRIFNPKNLDTLDQMQEFCGACHQSFDTVMQLPDRGGINNIRFQPYRMANSRGHFINDRRISCIACHDPHEKSEHEATYYDSKCLACHLATNKEARTEERQAPACSVSNQQCITCHMSKVEVQGLHYKFTDHWIRIIKPNDKVPY